MNRFNAGYSVFTLAWMTVVVVQTFFCLSASDWATWVGSIGTVGTLIGAVWIANTEARRRNNEDLMGATVVAAGLTPSVWALIQHLSRFSAYLSFGSDQTYVQTANQIFRGHAEFPALMPSESQLLALTSLGNKCAMRLAHAVSLVSVAKQQIAADAAATIASDKPLSRHMSASWVKKIDVVHDYLLVVHHDLEAAAQAYVTQPTGQELWGEENF